MNSSLFFKRNGSFSLRWRTVLIWGCPLEPWENVAFSICSWLAVSPEREPTTSLEGCVFFSAERKWLTSSLERAMTFWSLQNLAHWWEKPVRILTRTLIQASCFTLCQETGLRFLLLLEIASLPNALGLRPFLRLLIYPNSEW